VVVEDMSWALENYQVGSQSWQTPGAPKFVA
jgi:hypothetical protein